MILPSMSGKNCCQVESRECCWSSSFHCQYQIHFCHPVHLPSPTNVAAGVVCNAAYNACAMTWPPNIPRAPAKTRKDSFTPTNSPTERRQS